MPRSIAPISPPIPPLETNAGGAAVLGTAVYISGNTSLESGRRYKITIQGSRLRILGPMGSDESAVVLDRSLANIDAIAIENRVLVSEPGNRSGVAIAFMAVAGSTPERLATSIVEAARDATVA